MHTDDCIRFEPDAVVDVTIAGLARTNPYTEVTLPGFGEHGGIIVARGSFGGLVWTRLDTGSSVTKLMELAPGRMIRAGTSSLFLGQVAGAYGTTVKLECYGRRNGESWKELVEIVRLVGGIGMPSPSNGAGGGVAAAGTDVTVGDFTATGAADQISAAGTVLLAAGATRACTVIINRTGNDATDLGFKEDNTVVVTNNPIGPAGQDMWNVPAGGKLFMKGAAGQTCSVRVRS